MGLSPTSLKDFLENNCKIVNNQCINKITKKVIKACVPMHTFGHPCRINEIKVAAFSFNGNKIITSGGGGVIVTDDEAIAKIAKHITTTAKIPHPFEYVHDEIGYNYRLPNINAALLVAQLEQLTRFLEAKRNLSLKYKEFFSNNNINFIEEPKNSKSNYWLQAVLLNDKKQRDEFLEFTNKNGVMTRPIWKLMNELEMFKDCQKTDLKNSKYLEERVVNIPSSVIL
jgi:perosamine synthetase